MGVISIPNTCNSRIRGYCDANGDWLAVRVDQSGELAIHAEISDIVQARTSGQRSRIEGYYTDSGDWRPISVDASGEMRIEAVVNLSGIIINTSGQPVTISGDYVTIASGGLVVDSGLNVVVESGLGVQVESGAYLASGIHVIADVAVDVSSGIHVIVESGLGVQVESGAYLASGIHVIADVAVDVSSGIHVIVESGLGVQVESGAYLASGIHAVVYGGVQVSGALAVSGGVIVSGTIVAETSGQQMVVLGEDYVQASGCIASGAVEVPKTVTAIQELQAIVTSGKYEGMVPETRLLTGADNKHIRFHDMFDGDTLDTGKWELLTGTATVGDGACELEHAATAAIMQTMDPFLYGVLSFQVYMEDADEAGMEFGFVGEWTESAKDSKVAYEAGRFHTEKKANTPAAEPDEYTTVTLADDTWYNFQIIWTPTYAQLWVDGVLRANHIQAIPQSPCKLYFNSAANNYIYLDHVSLTAYGDIPTTRQGRVPVREQGGVIYAYEPLLVTQASGGQVLGSGNVDRVIMRVPSIACSGTAEFSGLGASGWFMGIWVGGTSGNRPYTGSGCVGSGKGLFLERGCQKELYVANLNEIWVAGDPSGYPVTFIGESMQRQAGY